MRDPAPTGGGINGFGGGDTFPATGHRWRPPPAQRIVRAETRRGGGACVTAARVARGARLRAQASAKEAQLHSVAYVRTYVRAPPRSHALQPAWSSRMCPETWTALAWLS
eukprot:scaffold2437_cov395-Prasinococcus_capsulatus_cf.AAC.26